jgi:hypothetical protein
VPSSEADPVQGRSGPSSEAEPARGKRTPLNGAEPARGRRAPSSEAEPARGDLRVGRLGGPLGPPRRGLCPAWLSEACLALLRVLSGDSPVVKGDPRAVPDNNKIKQMVRATQSGPLLRLALWGSPSVP